MAERQQLPRFIVLKSQKNDKYLIHLRDDQDYLQFSGTDFASLHVKFEVVRSNNTGDGLVHLKCCYNKMYWACRPDQWRISADAHEMEEDQTKRSCTLFKPVFFGTSNRIGFCHVNINTCFIFSPLYLSIAHPSQEGDYLDFFDWESLPILPRYIALKGDCGNYLSAYKAPQNPATPYLNVLKYFNPFVAAAYFIVDATEDENVYLSFNCKDKGDQAVGNEVFTTPDRKIRLKSNHIGKFWRRGPYGKSWICPDSEDNTNNNLDTIFEVTMVDQNKIALKNLGNNMYCQRHTDDCLNANSSTFPETAKFLVEELVNKRKIFNVRFNDNAAKIYEKEILSVVKSTDLNKTEVAIQAKMELEYTEEESRTWTTSNSLTQTVQIEITFKPPSVVEGKINYTSEVTRTVEDGKTLATKQVKKFTRDVNVPPNSKVEATFRVTHALCDIPYTYSQTETFTNGMPSITHDRDDGLYTSVCTEVYFEANQKGN